MAQSESTTPFIDEQVELVKKAGWSDSKELFLGIVAQLKCLRADQLQEIDRAFREHSRKLRKSPKRKKS